MVRGMRGVGGVCEMCMCLARGGVRGEGRDWKEDWVWALPMLWKQGSVGRVSVLGLRRCGWCMWELGVGDGLGQDLGWLCYVCVCCESGLFV